jgi:small subunit ribosomal protein S9
MAEAKKKKTTKKTTKKVEKKPVVKVEVKETSKTDSADKYTIKKDHITAVGRRKTSSASIFLYEGKGDILVNFVDIDEYFPSAKEKLKWMEPFHLIGVSHPRSKFNATIKVEGSGKSGQLGAVVHAMSRALAKLSEENQIVLSKEGFLKRDPRMVERKKYYLRKARKRPQYSKR